MVDDRIKLKSITIRKGYCVEEGKIVVNKQEMKIALANIIINGIEAMTFDNGELTLATKLINGKYIIKIEDNGCGINKKDLKYIFKPFFANKKDGLGIGLSTTYHILRSKHIEVIVNSKKGRGTRFMLLVDDEQAIQTP